MTVSYRRRIHWMGVAMIFAAAIIPAMGWPYLLGAPFAVGAVALLLGGEALLQQRAERALRALAGAAGSVVREHQEEESGAWLRGLGFTDFSQQVIRRLRAKSAEVAGGAASFVWLSIGPGKPTARVANVISAPSRAAGTLCLRAQNRGEVRRAKSIGGRVSTGPRLDERFVIYAEDAEAAKVAAGMLDPEAVDGLLRRVVVLGGTDEVAFAVVPGRASVLVEGAPAELFAPEAVREIVQALRTLINH